MKERHRTATRFRLYRDREEGLLTGVCAGLADRFGLSTLLVRTLVVIAGVMQPVAVAAVYFLLTLFLPDRPLDYRGRGDEASFWRSSACQR